MRLKRPTKELLTSILLCKTALPWQYVNWWLYQNGCNNLIRSYDDYQHPAYFWAFHNQHKIACELAAMQNMTIPKIADIEHLLDRKWRTR